MMGEPVIRHRPVVKLDVGILLRLAGLSEIGADTALCGPAKLTAPMYSGVLEKPISFG